MTDMTTETEVTQARREAAMLREIAKSEARGIDWSANLNATADFLESGHHRREAEKRTAPRQVPEGETPLDDNLGHRLLDVVNEGRKARNEGTSSPYDGHSLEHCLHATGWVQQDLRLALDKAKRTASRSVVEALEDAQSGWRYIHARYGALEGVGWDRVDRRITAALASLTTDDALVEELKAENEKLRAEVVMCCDHAAQFRSALERIKLIATDYGKGTDCPDCHDAAAVAHVALRALEGER